MSTTKDKLWAKRSCLLLPLMLLAASSLLWVPDSDYEKCMQRYVNVTDCVLKNYPIYETLVQPENGDRLSSRYHNVVRNITVIYAVNNPNYVYRHDVASILFKSLQKDFQLTHCIWNGETAPLRLTSVVSPTNGQEVDDIPCEHYLKFPVVVFNLLSVALILTSWAIAFDLNIKA